MNDRRPPLPVPLPGPLSIGALDAAFRHGEEPPPLPAIARQPSYRWLVVGTVCIGSLMGQIDASMTQLLLPRLEVFFDTRLSGVSWVAVSYLVSMASFTPIFGRMADMFGHKLLYAAGFLTFIIGSMLCGYAQTLPLLVAFRVLQGVGAALITANSVAIVVMVAGREARGRALGIQAAAQAVGLCTGPALGGLILDTLDWHWAFWINVPIGLLSVLLSWLVVPRSELPTVRESFDWRGAFLLLPSLTAVVAVLNQGHAWGFTSPAMIGCGVAALVLLALFVSVEHHSPAPLLDLRLLANPVFLLGNIASFLSYASLFGVFFLVPFVLVRVYADNSLQAGLRLSVLPVALALVSPIGGALYDRFGARLPAVAGLATCLAGLALLHWSLDGSSDHLGLVIVALAVFGAGQGLFISPNNSAIMAAAPAEETGQAAAVLNLMRLLGISAGIASGATVLSASLGAAAGRTLAVPPALMIAGGRDVIVMLGILLVGAAVLSLARSAPAKGD
ncbi:MAG: MFS transporter [Proteobacteria bacterium]|nr:MFS transporter [Pseudomonadota bacterium]